MVWQVVVWAEIWALDFGSWLGPVALRAFLELFSSSGLFCINLQSMISLFHQMAGVT
jgi:hypothetical protein